MAAPSSSVTPRLGGEPTRPLAMRAMRTSAATFFLRPPCPLSWEARRLAAWHMELGRILASSHVQLLAQPVTVHYQVHCMVHCIVYCVRCTVLTVH